MAGYTKLFSTIVTSSVWSEDDKTRIMWITFLATSDAKGHVDGAIPGMAAIARMSLEDAEKAIARLESPDPYSRNAEYEGRRIEKEEGGWRILNYQKYRETLNESERRSYKRQWDRENRPSGHQRNKEAEDQTVNGLFELFWDAYPRKVAKAAAYKAFVKLKPTQDLLDTMIASIAVQTQTDQWSRDGGKFIPHPATWLNQRRWEDEVTTVKPDGVSAAEAIQMYFEMGDITEEERDRQLAELEK